MFTLLVIDYLNKYFDNGDLLIGSLNNLGQVCIGLHVVLCECLFASESKLSLLERVEVLELFELPLDLLLLCADEPELIFVKFQTLM